MKRYIKASKSFKSEYFGIEYVIAPKNKGYVFVVPDAIDIKSIKASGFGYTQTEVESGARDCIDKFIKYAINRFRNSRSVDLTPCPQCGVADYYDSESKACANCGYYEDSE